MTQTLTQSAASPKSRWFARLFTQTMVVRPLVCVLVLLSASAISWAAYESLFSQTRIREINGQNINCLAFYQLKPDLVNDVMVVRVGNFTPSLAQLDSPGWKKIRLEMRRPASGNLMINGEAFSLTAVNEPDGTRLRGEIPLAKFVSYAHVELNARDSDDEKIFHDETTLPEF